MSVDAFLFACEKSRELGLSAPALTAPEVDELESEIRGLCADNDRLRAKFDAERGCLSDERKRSDGLIEQLREARAELAEARQANELYCEDQNEKVGEIERLRSLVSINSDAATRFNDQLRELREAAESLCASESYGDWRDSDAVVHGKVEALRAVLSKTRQT